MTPRERVGRTRAMLVIGIVARAILWGAAALLAVIGVAALLDLVVGLPHHVRRLTLPVAWLTAAVVMLALLWRGRRVRSLAATALWIEERVPSLQYALVTSLEQDAERSGSLLAREVERHRWESAILPRALTRATVPPLVAVGVATVMLFALPSGVVARVRAPRAGDALDRPAVSRRADASRLTPLVARVLPPPYAALGPTSVDEPSTIEALAGSRIELEGRGPADGITATVGNTELAAATRGSRWSLNLTMPASPSRAAPSGPRFRSSDRA